MENAARRIHSFVSLAAGPNDSVQSNKSEGFAPPFSIIPSPLSLLHYPFIKPYATKPSSVSRQSITVTM